MEAMMIAVAPKENGSDVAIVVASPNEPKAITAPPSVASTTPSADLIDIVRSAIRRWTRP